MTREERAKVWDTMHAFVRNRGGYVVSIPHSFPLRVECSAGSSLPEMLEGLGYPTRQVGTAERLMPGEDGQIAPTTVAAFEIGLPVD